MTSAPMSAMIWVQYGPITMAVRSTTRTPLNGPVRSTMLHSICASRNGHPEAVADVVVVPVGHHREDDRLGHVPDGVDLLTHLLDRPRGAVHARRFGDGGAREPAADRDQDLSGD